MAVVSRARQRPVAATLPLRPTSRAAALIESQWGGWLLAATGLMALLLSLASAIISDPASASRLVISATGAGAAMVLALAYRPSRAWLSVVAAMAAIGLTGAYVAEAFSHAPTAVWLFAFVVPAIGLAHGPRLGGVAGFLAAPVLHWIETGLPVDAVDPQAPFGIVVLVALGAVPGYLMALARERRAALDGQLQLAETLLAEAVRARSAEQAANEQAVFMLARAAEARDGTTGAHIQQVRDLAVELAIGAGIGQEQATVIGWSAMLHDVGKLRVPDRILLKPGRLDAEEWELIRRHTSWGEELLEGTDHFDLARRIARWHHENWDGSGYPDGLAGGAIPFEARIVRVVDVYDALRAARPYKSAWSDDQSLEELRRSRGKHFDPELLDLFLRLRGA